MSDTDRSDVLSRWPGAVRGLGHGDIADVLDRWLAREGVALVLPEDVGRLRADAVPRDIEEAFAGLGARTRTAGVDLEALHAAMRALDETVSGAGDGAYTGATALHGLAVGGWHAEPEAGSGGGGLDPELGRILRHDIKTPLQAVSLNLELLAMDQEGNADVTGAVATIMESLDSAVEMLQRFDEV